MGKGFSDRLAALEELEAEYHTDDPALAAIEHLSDDAVLAEAFEGLRSRKLFYFQGQMTAMADGDYWRGIAVRAWDLCVERQVWISPLTEEDATIARQALLSGVWLMRIRNTSYTDPWYEPVPPEPFFTGCWETREYQALKQAARALLMWGRFWWWEGPPMPATTGEVIAWMEWAGNITKGASHDGQ